MPTRRAAATSDTATAEEDAKDFDCACASSRTCFQRVLGKSTDRKIDRQMDRQTDEMTDRGFNGCPQSGLSE